MTYKEGIEALETVHVKTIVPTIQADQLKRQLATAGDENAQMPPELETAVNDVIKRREEASKPGGPN